MRSPSQNPLLLDQNLIQVSWQYCTSSKCLQRHPKISLQGILSRCREHFSRQQQWSPSQKMSCSKWLHSPYRSPLGSSSLESPLPVVTALCRLATIDSTEFMFWADCRFLQIWSLWQKCARVEVFWHGDHITRHSQWMMLPSKRKAMCQTCHRADKSCF